MTPIAPVCRAPYVSLNLDPLGTVRACCQNVWNMLGRIPERTLSEIWNGPEAAALRNHLVSTYGPGCESCADADRHGGPEASYARVFDRHAVSQADPPWPRQLELALSNTCNLRCVMCNGSLSSSIRSQREHLPPLPNVYGEAFFEDLRLFLPYLERIVLLGGEPFLARESLRVFAEAEALGVQPRFDVTTNGTIWNQRIDRLLDRFEVDVTVSVDAVDDAQVRALRVGTDPEVLWRNVHRFVERARQRGTRVSFAYCLMTTNWEQFRRVCLLADDLDVDVFVNEVNDPAVFSPSRLSVAELAGLVAGLDRVATRGAPLERNAEVWERELRRLRSVLDRSEQGDLLDPPVLRRSSTSKATPPVIMHIDAAQVLREVSPSAADVFGVDLTSVIGHPHWEWMPLFQARYGTLEASSVRRSAGGSERWELVVGQEDVRHRMCAIYEADPSLDGSGQWTVTLERI